MLRRPATTIKLTPEDVFEYDDQLKREASDRTQNQQSNNSYILQEQLNNSAHDNRTNQIGSNAKEESKEDRIGVSRRN